MRVLSCSWYEVRLNMVSDVCTTNILKLPTVKKVGDAHPRSGAEDESESTGESVQNFKINETRKKETLGENIQANVSMSTDHGLYMVDGKEDSSENSSEEFVFHNGFYKERYSIINKLVDYKALYQEASRQLEDLKHIVTSTQCLKKREVIERFFNKNMIH